MSNLLWGINQLVSEPSFTFIRTLQKQFFKSKSSHEDITAAAETTANNLHAEREVKNSSIKDHNIDAHSIEVLGTSETKKENKETQIGKGFKKHDHLSTNSFEIKNLPKKVSKATSAHKVHTVDQCIGADVCPKKDFSCKTEKHRLCKEHQQVFELLKKWPTVKMPKNEKTTLKSKLLQAIKILSIEKIQTVPPYHGDHWKCMKLYRSVSEEEFYKERKTC